MTAKELLIHQLNPRTLLVTVDDEPRLSTQSRLWVLIHSLRESSTLSAHIEELVPGMGNLMIRCQTADTLVELQTLISALWARTDTSAPPGRLHEIAVKYNDLHGPDLTELAGLMAMSQEEFIHLHGSREYQVYCLGFQAGFAYMGDIDERLRFPRRDTPRTRVPSGSVAIAGQLTGIYPAESPGGWHIIGHTDTCLFDINRTEPTLFQPGDRVRFVPV
ncbi:MAG: 5-oxoprolinase subunit PxpB [Pseudomonadales bacterium]|nr:5-oxoprolinase subunit PxpB [Pseudomonadales bacterium]